MWSIARVQVNGGFLGGLDVELSSGLNVVIGPRGSGKTTLLELIRHALGAKHPDAAHQKQSEKLVKAVLGDGEVILDLRRNEVTRRVVVDAKGTGRDAAFIEALVVLGQNELENAAADPTSRRNLLDLHNTKVREAFEPLRARASLLTGELYDLRQRRTVLAEATSLVKNLSRERADLLARREAHTLSSSVDMAQRLDELTELDSDVTQIQSRKALLESTEVSLTSLLVDAEGLTRDATRVSANLTASQDASLIRAKLGSWSSHFEAGLGDLVAAHTETVVAIRVLAEEGEQKRQLAAPLRAEVEELQSGLGELTAAISSVEGQLATLSGDAGALQQISEELKTKQDERASIYLELEEAQNELFETRLESATRVSANVGLNVTVSLEHLSDISQYKSVVSEELQGSSIRSSTVETLCAEILPRMLLEALETDTSNDIVAASSLSATVLERVLERLRERRSLVRLAGAVLDDEVMIRLVDGTVEKNVEELSTGQKCSVSLPIILTEEGKSLILDQPEDHLDNEFLVQNVVTVLENRASSGIQTLVATHNANIPVLGGANVVITLASDGEHGFVETIGKFSDDPIVERVTSLMEGGREAFLKRKRFYEEHGSISA